jgi:hydrogenase-4 component B
MIALPDRWEAMLLVLALACVFGGASLALARGAAARRTAAALAFAGSVAGAIGSAAIVVWGSRVVLLDCPSGVIDARVSFEADALSAAFLVPLFIVSGLGAIYALGYASGDRRLALSHGLLVGSTALVLTAKDGVSFLVAWEVMALSAFVAATAEDRGEKVRAAGLAYLIATHTGTLLLLAMVLLMRGQAGSFSWAASLGTGAGVLPSAIFVLALLGFGLKAGIVPLHFWLPAAHANAPSHVSATMSAVMLKTGIYGILRITSRFDVPPLWWGTVLVIAGSASALVGIALASGQTDIKRALAYSSVENIGIVCIAIGLALLGRASGHADWVAIGIAAAVLHVLNHALFKSLLFFGAGAIVHATGTREMDALGGLMQKMPRAGAAIVYGAVAAAGIPPLNGFLGEWVLYLGLFGAWTSEPAVALTAALAIGALAAVGALAVAAFVRLIGITLLGAPRSDTVERAQEPGASMLGPMIALCVLCALVAVGGPWLVELTAPVAGAWGGVVAHESRAALSGLSTEWISVFALVVTALFAMAFARVGRRTSRAVTWDCGYAAPSARMQYTGRSFGEWIAERFTPRVLRASPYVVPPSGLFPREASYGAEAPDPFQEKLYERAMRAIATRLSRARRLQQGHLNVYLLYTLIALVALLVYSAFPLAEILP